jgi:hypothetical protein
MQTASELLGLTPPAPLSAILVARPVRACIVVPSVEGVAWQRLVEHALAAQTRVWGGSYNLVVPGGLEVAEDELFWRLVDRFDPDVMGLHLPTFADVEEIAPDIYAEAVERLHQQLRDKGFEEQTRADEISRLRDRWFWQWEMPDELRLKLVERVAPLRLGDDDPRTVYTNGTTPPAYPLTDVADLRELPGGVLDIRSTLDDVDQLLLTHAVGRLLPSFRNALEERGVVVSDVLIGHEELVFTHIWPQGYHAQEYGYPRLLVDRLLGRRISFAAPDQVVVVVGDEPRDFLLYHGLSRLRADVYWLPAARLGNEIFVRGLSEAIWHAVRTGMGGGGELAVTTASSVEAAAAAVDVLNGVPGRRAPDATPVDWRTLIPQSYVWSGDPRSERRVVLLRHEGETQDLQTPPPVSVSVPDDDPSKLRWMVDVEVQGWRPARHSALGSQVLRGPVVTDHDVRASAHGPSYFGLGPFVQAFLGLEGSTARPRLRPRAVAEQVADILQPLGWQTSLSDKGAYALQSARLFGGVDGLGKALRSGATRALLDAYLTRTTTNDPGIYLKDTRRRYLTLADAGQLVEGTDVAALAAELYDRGVLVRGHILKCEHCRAASFYSLTEEQRFTCVRCQTVQRTTRFSWLGKPEPEFHYALSEVLLQFLDNNGQLPLLGAYDHFVVGRERERLPFDIAFELELTPPAGSLREHDIVATWGAELWIGEATVKDSLGETNAEETERVGRLAESARALGVRGVLLVTTSESFSARTKHRVANAFQDPVWPEVVYREAFDAGSAAMS